MFLINLDFGRSSGVQQKNLEQFKEALLDPSLCFDYEEFDDNQEFNRELFIKKVEICIYYKYV